MSLLPKKQIWTWKVLSEVSRADAVVDTRIAG